MKLNESFVKRLMTLAGNADYSRSFITEAKKQNKKGKKSSSRMRSHDEDEDVKKESLYEEDEDLDNEGDDEDRQLLHDQEGDEDQMGDMDDMGDEDNDVQGLSLDSDEDEDLDSEGLGDEDEDFDSEGLGDEDEDLGSLGGSGKTVEVDPEEFVTDITKGITNSMQDVMDQHFGTGAVKVTTTSKDEGDEDLGGEDLGGEDLDEMPPVSKKKNMNLESKRVSKMIANAVFERLERNGFFKKIVEKKYQANEADDSDSSKKKVTVTNSQIKKLRDEAKKAGDTKKVKLCDRALEGDVGARAACAKAIGGEKPMNDSIRMKQIKFKGYGGVDED